jgi:hypothetical protein
VSGSLLIQGTLLVHGSLVVFGPLEPLGSLLIQGTLLFDGSLTHWAVFFWRNVAASSASSHRQGAQSAPVLCAAGRASPHRTHVPITALGVPRKGQAGLHAAGRMERRRRGLLGIDLG